MQNGYSREDTMCIVVYLRQNQMFRLSKNTELSMEEIHHHVLQFIDGTRNL